MSTNLHIVLVVLLVLRGCQSRIAMAPSLSPDMHDPCSASDFKDLCRSVVKDQTNVNTATEVSIRELMKKTIEAKEVAVSKTGERVEICDSNYDNALANLQKALDNIKENDGFSLNINLSASLTEFDTCNEAMGEDNVSNVLAKSTSTLHEMADNCLALSSLVKQ